MKKMVYILPVCADKSISPTLGVYKKVLAQIKGFKANDIDVELYEGEILPKYLRALPFSTTSIDWNSAPINEDVDAVYIRYTFFDFQLLKFCAKIKRKWPKIKIIIELPTYPYDKEYSLKSIKTIRDFTYRKFMHLFIDRYATYSNDTVIFKTKTIKIMNGIDFDNVLQKSASDNLLKGNDIEMCCVANFAFWHGLDRIVNGLVEYYSEPKDRIINLHMVGNSNDTSEQLKELLKNTNAEKHVIWEGSLNGASLDNIYNKCNLAIECLGIFRKDIHLSSSLKSREYLAKGLPFIFSGKVDIIPNDFPFCKEFPEVETSIPMDEVVAFFDDVYGNMREKEVNKYLREFAIDKCSIEKMVEPIVEYILNG